MVKKNLRLNFNSKKKNRSFIGIFLLLENFFHYVIHSILPFFPEIKIIFMLAFCTNPESSSNLISAIMIPILKSYGIDILKIQSKILNQFIILIHPYYIDLSRFFFFFFKG